MDYRDRKNDKYRKKRIECLKVLKVYDFCFRNVHKVECFDVDIPEGTTEIRCRIIDLTCEEVPAMRRQIGGGLARVVIRKRFRLRLGFFDQYGNSLGTVDTEQRTLTETLVLCAPPGTEVQCEITDFSCGDCEIVDGTVCCQVDICQLIEVKAWVKVLVPIKGFCEPVECPTAFPKEFECPPPTLFPPQCTPSPRPNHDNNDDNDDNNNND